MGDHPSAQAQDELAAYYDERYEGPYMLEQAWLEPWRVREVLGTVPGPVGTVLDFGCGQGAWAPLLSEAFPGAEVAGVDVSAVAIEKAQARFPGFSFATLEGDEAPFEDARFDLVFTYHVLEHVLELEAVIAEMGRLIRPGGRLVAIFPCANQGSLEERTARLMEDGVDARSGRFFYEDPGHLRRLTTEQAVQAFAREGLTLERAFHANQRWGAVLWLAGSGAAVIRQLFDPGRAASPAAARRLRRMRALLLLLAPLVQVHLARSPLRRAASAGSMRERVKWGAVAAAKLFAWPVGAALIALARREWRQRSGDPAGSAQYLVFVRSG